MEDYWLYQVRKDTKERRMEPYLELIVVVESVWWWWWWWRWWWRRKENCYI